LGARGETLDEPFSDIALITMMIRFLVGPVLGIISRGKSVFQDAQFLNTRVVRDHVKLLSLDRKNQRLNVAD